MCILYGYSELTQLIVETFLVPWDAYYNQSRKDIYCRPYSGNSGYPIKWMFGGWVDTHSHMRLISHIFDDDDTVTITTLKIRYTLTTIMKDGSEHNDERHRYDYKTDI